MEIDITDFFNNVDAWPFSGSIATHGPNAAKNTWAAAKDRGAREPLLATPEQLDALRDHMRGFGAWETAEIDAWTPEECNALLIQLIAGNMREAGSGRSGRGRLGSLRERRAGWPLQRQSFPR